MTLNIALAGASGYAGGEVLRLLAGHPGAEVVAAGASARAGLGVEEIHPHLLGATALKTMTIDEVAAVEADAFVSCLPSGELVSRLDSVVPEKIIDLSDDFRGHPDWAYGLTEHARSRIANSRRLANPGCYPTAALLALLPFASAGIVTGPTVVVDAISGVSGAGRKPADRLMFSAADGGVGAYGPLPHRHVAEIERALGECGLDVTVSFTPHLAPMSRGLVATVRAPLSANITQAEAVDVLHEAYAGEPFVAVIPDWPQSKPVAGTNNAHVSARVDARAELLVASCAIDNLGKGAAGQAIQNLNLMSGLEETAGLEGLGVWP